MISVSVSITPAQPALTKYRVKEDWLTRRWKYQARPVAPDPGVFPVSSTPDDWPQTDFCLFPEPWQRFVANILAMKKYGKLLNELRGEEYNFIVTAFNVLTSSDRAFNNGGNGTDVKNNYITGEMRGEESKWESLITCTNFVYGIGEATAQKGDWWRGKKMVQLLSFHANEAPPIVTPEIFKHPCMQVAKIVYPDKYVTNFSMLGIGVEVPVPFLTRGPRWYVEEELEKV